MLQMKGAFTCVFISCTSKKLSGREAREGEGLSAQTCLFLLEKEVGTILSMKLGTSITAASHKRITAQISSITRSSQRGLHHDKTSTMLRVSLLSERAAHGQRREKVVSNRVTDNRVKGKGHHHDGKQRAKLCAAHPCVTGRVSATRSLLSPSGTHT